MGLKELLTKDIGPAEGPKPLTFQKTLSVLLFIPCLFLFLIGYLGDNPAKAMPFRLWGWVFFLSSMAFAVWHIRATSSRRNIYPDVLSTIFAQKDIFEAGGIQLSFIIFQMKNEIRIAAITQNLHDSITTVQMDFSLQLSRNATPIVLQSLKHSLGPSELALAQYGFPLSIAQMQNQHIKITPSIRTKIAKRAPVRFDKRQVFDTKTKPWLSILMLVGPMTMFGGGRFFTLGLSPVAVESKSRTSPQWTVHTLWSPKSIKSKEEIINIINSATSGEPGM